MATYRALAGISYPPDRRVEPGDLTDDLPAKSIKWLREGGYIELVGAEEVAPVEEAAPVDEVEV